MANNAEYFWLLNNDAVIDSKCLSQMIKYAQSDSAVGLLSPAIYSLAERDQLIYCGSFVSLSPQKAMVTRSPFELGTWQSKDPRNIVLWGTALLIPRYIVECVGYLDEKNFA